MQIGYLLYTTSLGIYQIVTDIIVIDACFPGVELSEYLSKNCWTDRPTSSLTDKKRLFYLLISYCVKTYFCRHDFDESLPSQESIFIQTKLVQKTIVFLLKRGVV